MKKLLIIAGAVLALSLGLIGMVSADNGPHGGYSATTDACAGCHRAHTAKGAYLMVEGSAENSSFCNSCHDGTGAYTNVVNGVLNATLDASLVISSHTTLTGTVADPNLSLNDMPLKGGGFVNAKMNTNYGTGPATSRPVASSHSVNGSAQTAWGNGGVVTNTANYGVGNVDLTCTNCHNPHGSSGANNQPTYRILRGLRPNGLHDTGGQLFQAVNGGITTTQLGVTDVTDLPNDKMYVISNTNTMIYFQANTTGGANQNGIYSSTTAKQLSAWCATCHTRYLANSGSYKDKTQGGSRPAEGDAVFMYQHTSSADKSYTAGCMTCHVAHGTAAVAKGNYDQNLKAPDPTDVNATIGVSNSKLLRMDGRGVCQGCHNK